MSDTAATIVNPQITDSVTQVNTKVVGETPAQQQGQITMHAATVQGVNSLMSVGSAVIGRTSEEIIEKK